MDARYVFVVPGCLLSPVGSGTPPFPPKPSWSRHGCSVCIRGSRLPFISCRDVALLRFRFTQADLEAVQKQLGRI